LTENNLWLSADVPLFSETYEQQGPALPLKTEADWRKMISNYWGLCSLVDTHVGRIQPGRPESETRLANHAVKEERRSATRFGAPQARCQHRGGGQRGITGGQ